ncbi:MAG: efflux RND transporter periplasmic adaptor subunit [Burkholderiaceae bacterium]
MSSPTVRARGAIASRAAAVLALVASLGACERPPPVTAEPVRPVRTMTVVAQAARTDTAYPAEIRPRIESRLGFRVPGKIIERYVDAGARVKVGQPLARLDPRDLSLSASAAKAQVAQAQANFELAQVALTRTQALASQNFVSGAQVDQAQTQLKAARAQLDAAIAQASTQVNQAGYATLVADRAGVVTAIEAEVGQVVAVGSPVVRVAVGQDKDVVFSLPEQEGRVLQPGEPIEVRLWSAPDLRLKAVVRDVAPLADPSTRTYPIKAALEDPGNVASLGLTASAHLIGRHGDASQIVLPLTAVVGDTATPRQAYVWVVEDGVAQRVPVAIGGPVGAGLRIVDGLRPGQVVITAGVHTIKPGQKVVPMADSASAR